MLFQYVSIILYLQTNCRNMSTVMYNKIYKFLTTAEKRQINATSVIYIGMKKNRWIPQTELKTVVERAVSSASNVFMEGSSCQLRVFQILPQVS